MARERGGVESPTLYILLVAELLDILAAKSALSDGVFSLFLLKLKSAEGAPSSSLMLPMSGGWGGQTGSIVILLRRYFCATFPGGSARQSVDKKKKN